MKRIIFSALFAVGLVCSSFCQESKPVIGLTEISYQHGGYASIAKQVRAAFSSSIVNSRRFAVMERSASELDKIRRENIETEGSVNANTRLDFLLTAEIVSYDHNVESYVVPIIGTKVTNHSYKLVLSVKFTDVKTGQIVISEVMSKEVKGDKIKEDECAKELADELIAKIITKLYPPTVLSVNKSGKVPVVQTLNSDYEIGDVLEVYKEGEELLDPYNGTVIGYEEEFVCFIVVYEINDKTNIAKAAPDPKGKYKDAEIEKGYMIRAVTKQSGKKTVKETNKTAITNLKSVGIIKK